MGWNDDYEQPCYYCGMPATEIDHVVPQALLASIESIEDREFTNEFLAHRRLTVPCCRECNARLSDSYQETLTERKAYVKQKLRMKYAKLLTMPDWTDAELAGLGPTLRLSVQHALAARRLVRQRLAW